MKQITGVIADDEELLRSHLRTKLTLSWPELVLVGEAGDGEDALRLIRGEKPDVAFLDIQMPGRSGLDVAREAAGSCLVVFVTAFDKFAIEAFERAAIDYLLKPVSDDRLQVTVKRLKERLAGSSALPDLAGVLETLTTKQPQSRLLWIKAQHKGGIRLIPAGEVLYFRAGDKYTTVRTKEAEYVISTTIKELEAGLDPGLFWRVHRAAIVNVKAVYAVAQGIAGTLTISFKDIPDQLAVSRTYAHLFKQM